MQVELVVDARAALGEGPAWDAVTQSLFWVDIEAGKLHAYRSEGEADRVWDVGCLVGAAVPREVGGMVLATARGFTLFDLATSEQTPLSHPESDRANNRFNDGKCDPHGRFWAGTMSMVRESKAGSLYVLEPDRTVRLMLGGVTTSNGLAWSPDQATMYYIDTPTMMVQAFDYEGTTGTIANGRMAIRFEQDVGRPDGMTIDADGMLWIAHWSGGRVTRWNPRNGRLLDTVLLPVAQVTSCAFGGSDLRTLFITTARRGLDDGQLVKQPYAGGLFAIRPNVGGVAATPYAG